MLCAELWYFDTGIDGAHCFVAYAINLVAKNEGIFLACFSFKIVQHNAVPGLFNGNDGVTFLA